MNAKANEVVKKDEVKAPALIGAGSAIEGMEEIDQDDIVLPRIKLLQGSAEQIKNPKEYPGLHVGMLVNSVTSIPLASQEVAGNTVYPFVPVKMFKSWIKFNAMKRDDDGFDPAYEPGDLIYRTYDKNDPFVKDPNSWQYKQTNFLGFQPGTTQPIILTLGSSSAKVGKDMINFISLAGRSLFEHLFHLGSKGAEKDGNSFEVFTARSIGIPEEADVKIARQMFHEFNPILSNLKAQSNVQIHEDAPSAFKETNPADNKEGWDE